MIKKMLPLLIIAIMTQYVNDLREVEILYYLIPENSRRHAKVTEVTTYTGTRFKVEWPYWTSIKNP